MPSGFYGQNGQSAVMSPSRVRPHGRQAIALSARSRIRTTPPAPADRTPTRNMARAMTRSAGWSWGSSVRSPAKLTLASVMVRPYLLPGRAVCHALGPGGRWTLRSRDRPSIMVTLRCCGTAIADADRPRGATTRTSWSDAWRIAQSPVMGDAAHLARLYGRLGPWCRTRQLGARQMGQDDSIGREVLPIPERPHVGLVTYDAKDPATSFPPIESLRPPAGAPNVLVVLLDDVGFGASSAFGGPISTPTAERLAAQGLKYTRFHTTALCAPTRAALLTGRNHHAVGMGGITEIATSAPGYNSMRPNTCAPLAEILKLNGYSTAQFGKCHEVPVWQTSPMGPFDNWPTGSGFEYFYGFIGGEAHQYYPALYEGTTPVEPDRTPEEGYHLMGDMTDKAITWVHQQKSLMPDKPFFAYFAPGATHAPHHVPQEWADRYAGRFDDGWDALRERTFARQKELGVVPQDAQLTPRHEQIPAWDDMPEELKPVLRRQMEVYAGFLDYTDHHVGRLIDSVDRLGLLDDTLV